MTQDFQSRLNERLDLYAKNFRIEDLNDANDRSLLNIMLKTELMIDDLQQEIQTLIQEDAVERASDIKKLADLLRDATNTITTVQKTLAIDRKSRKEEETGSVADYIKALTRAALAHQDLRLQKVYCPACKVMVGRFSPVHNHTSLIVSFQCSQCRKMVRVRRDEKDTLYDIKLSDRNWRMKYRAEIVQPRKAKVTDKPDDDDLDDSPDLILDHSIETEEEIAPVVDKVGQDLEL